MSFPCLLPPCYLVTFQTFACDGVMVAVSVFLDAAGRQDKHKPQQSSTLFSWACPPHERPANGRMSGVVPSSNPCTSADLDHDG